MKSTSSKKKTKAPALLTPAEMAAAAPYECNMRTAVDSNYARSIGPAGVDVLNGILKAHGRPAVPGAGSCVACTLSLLQQVGAMYFETKKDATQSIV